MMSSTLFDATLPMDSLDDPQLYFKKKKANPKLPPIPGMDPFEKPQSNLLKSLTMAGP
jgi:hypothetical protein